MIKREDLIKLYKKVFNEEGTIITDNVEDIEHLCKLLLILTNIQTCNKYFQVYEYIHDVYRSSLKILEEEE